MTAAHLSARPGPGRCGIFAGFIGGAGIVLILGGALWLLFGARLPAATPNLSAEQQRGEAIYNANCVSCHGGRTGGGMMDYPPRHNANGHTWHHPDCELTAIVRDGSNEMTDAMREMMAPPDAPKMQAFKDRLSAEEIAAVLAFIKTMWTPEEREAQALITQDTCPTVRLQGAARRADRVNPTSSDYVSDEAP